MIKADYTIELQDGSKIPLLFNTWTFRNYSYKTGIEFEDLYDITRAIKTKDLPLLLISASDSYNTCSKDPQAKSYSDVDACLWLDEIGFTAISPGVKHIYAICISKLTGKTVEEIEAQMKVEEKTITEEAEGKGSPKKKKVSA